MPRPEKVAAVEEISQRFSEAEAALLTEYRGLTVPELAELRAELRKADAEYKVLKNTLARIAVKELGMEDLIESLVGPTAIAFVRGDVAAAAKALDDAAKRFPVLVVKGGVLKGKVIGADQTRTLATLPSREVLLSQTAMLFNSPAQQLANVLSALLRNLGSMLAQVVAKKESGELPTAAAQGDSVVPVEAPADKSTEEGAGETAAEATDGPPPADDGTVDSTEQEQEGSPVEGDAAGKEE